MRTESLVESLVLVEGALNEELDEEDEVTVEE